MIILVFTVLFVTAVAKPHQKTRIPLMDHLRAPLIAELDVSDMNQQLQEFIEKEVDIQVNQSKQNIEELIETESLKIKELTQLENAMEANYSSSVKKINEINKRQFSALADKLQAKINELPPTSTACMNNVTSPVRNVKKLSGSQGKSFIVTFIRNIYTRKPQLIYIMSYENLDGTCNLKSPYNSLTTTLDIKRNATTVYKVSQSLELADGMSRKGIYIQCNIVVTVIAFNEETETSDGFLTLPISMLGTDYIVPSYSSVLSSIAGIASPYNNTDITVNLRLKSGYFTYNGENYKNGSKLRFTMEALDTFQISVSGDISGTYIKSNKPIAVVSGDYCANVQGAKCSHLSEMILSVTQFSNLFIVPMLKKGYSAKLRAFLNMASRIALTSKRNTNQTFTVANQNYKEFDYNDIYVVSSSENVLVQLYSNPNLKMGDGFMMTIPGIDQYLDFYIFNVPDIQFRSSLSFIIKSNELNGIRVDGNPINNMQITMRNVTVTGVQYSTFSYDISPGMHKAEHINNIPFALFVYGYKRHDGYGYLAGIGQ